MNEGWFGDNYYVLFAETEVKFKSQRYGVDTALPGYSAIGLRDWADLVVRDRHGDVYSVPVVPIDLEYLSPCDLPDGTSLESHSRFTGRVKWYVTPLIFGGDPKAEENVTWVSHEHHAELVVWWNQQYYTLKPGRPSA